MPKVTYLLIQSAHGAYPTPIAVCGSGVLGHALYDPKHGAHVFRFSKEDWEGGIDRQIAENKNRSFGKWIIRADVEPDLESPEGKHAQEVDALRARIAELETKLALPSTEEQPPAEDDQAEVDLAERAAGGAPPTECPRGSTYVVNPDGSKVVARIAPDLSEMGFPELEALFNKLNIEGAGLVLPAEGKPSKVKYRDALNAYYAAK